MTHDPITWTGEPDDQRAEWRGMVAKVIRNTEPEESQWMSVVWRVTGSGDENLFHSRVWGVFPDSGLAGRSLCELVMRHERAKAMIDELNEQAARSQTYHSGYDADGYPTR
jgi:hypothetical protein